MPPAPMTAHFKLPKSIVKREEFILEKCKNKRVLHLGCAAYPFTRENIESGKFLHSKITDVADSCVGVDLNAEAVKDLREQWGYENVIVGDAERLDELGLDPFDLVVAGEIIEHLNNPGLFLKSAWAVMKDESELLITTTNAFCLRRILRVVFGKESVHPHHTYYFSHITLRSLVTRFGYKQEEAHSYFAANKSPLLPYLAERLSSLISSNLGEGVVHVYAKHKS